MLASRLNPTNPWLISSSSSANVSVSFAYTVHYITEY
jgi:hypothetical protein